MRSIARACHRTGSAQPNVRVEDMSLNNEICDSSDDESVSSSIIFSSGRSSSPTWSRSSSMSSGTSAISTTSSESKRKLKARFGPITRPSTTELKFDEPKKDCQCQVQQQNSQETNPKAKHSWNKQKNFSPVPPKIVGPTANKPHTQAWFTSTNPYPMPNSQVPYFPPTMMYCPPLPPPIPMPTVYPTPVPYSVPIMPLPFVGPSMYRQPHVHVISVQAHYTTTSWTYIKCIR